MPDTPAASAGRPPAPMVVAVSLVAVQGAVLVLLALLETASITDERRSLGISTAAFFAGYGVLLLLGAAGLLRRAGWARGPILLTQLVMLGLAWNLRDTPALAVGLALVAAITLAGVVHPATIEALAASDQRDQTSDSND